MPDPMSLNISSACGTLRHAERILNTDHWGSETIASDGFADRYSAVQAHALMAIGYLLLALFQLQHDQTNQPVPY